MRAFVVVMFLACSASVPTALHAEPTTTQDLNNCFSFEKDRGHDSYAARYRSTLFCVGDGRRKESEPTNTLDPWVMVTLDPGEGPNPDPDPKDPPNTFVVCNTTMNNNGRIAWYNGDSPPTDDPSKLTQSTNVGALNCSKRLGPATHVFIFSVDDKGTAMPWRGAVFNAGDRPPDP